MSSLSIQNRISLLIKAKRRETELGVNAAAKAAKISAPTLSRLERGISATLPDVDTLTKLAVWLGVSVSELMEPKPKSTALRSNVPQNTTPEIVEVHLRADKNLSPETAKALANMFKVLYENATGKIGK